MLEGFYSGQKFASHISHWVAEMGGGDDGEKPPVSAGCPRCSRPEQSFRGSCRDVPRLKELKI